MVEQDSSHMMLPSFRISIKSKRTWNIVQYRKALGRVKRGKNGIYPLKDAKGNYVFYVMHRNLEKLRLLCMNYLKCPCHFIRFKYRSTQPVKFYYVILTDYHAEMWLQRMTYGKDESWRKI